MKTLYTILFFFDTLLLIALASILLRMIDNKADYGILVLVVLGLILTIAFLAFILIQYVKEPFPGKDS